MTPQEKYEKDSLTPKQTIVFTIIVILALLFGDNLMKL